MARRWMRRSTSTPMSPGSATRTTASARASNRHCMAPLPVAGCCRRSTHWTAGWVRTRTLEELTAAGDLRWFAPALDHLRSTPGTRFLTPDVPVVIARAPGRLDVMGGIADYSGSVVLELPLACATFAIAEKQADARLDIVSLRDGNPFEFSVELGELLTGAL